MVVVHAVHVFFQLLDLPLPHCHVLLDVVQLPLSIFQLIFL